MAFVGAGACAGLVGQAIGLGMLQWPSGGQPWFPWWEPPAANASTASGYGLPGSRTDEVLVNGAALAMAERQYLLQAGWLAPAPAAFIGPRIAVARSAPAGSQPAMTFLPDAFAPGTPLAPTPQTGSSVLDVPGAITQVGGDAAPDVVGPVGGVVTGTVGDVVTDTSGIVGQVATGTTGTVGQVVTDTTGTVDEVVTGTTATVGQVVTGTTGTVGQVVTDTTGTVGDVVTDTTGTVGQVATSTTGAVGDVATDTTSTVGQVATDTTATVGQVTTDTTSTVGDTVAVRPEPVVDAVEDIVHTATGSAHTSGEGSASEDAPSPGQADAGHGSDDSSSDDSSSDSVARTVLDTATSSAHLLR